MTEQIVKPAGAGNETGWVALCALAIVLVAGAVIGVRGEAPVASPVAVYQLDARDDLTPAEQGLYADLRLVVVELPDLHPQARPPVADLQAAALPPFSQDMGTTGRGGHVWSLLHGDPSLGAYFGLSAEPAVAGSLLLRLATPAKGDTETHASDEPDIWLHRAAQPSAPSRLDTESLIAAGWQQVVSRFDAGVTRHAH